MKKGLILKNIHPWEVSPKEAIQIQESLREQVLLRGGVRGLRWVAACDVAYHPSRPELVGGVVVWDVLERVTTEAHLVRGQVRFPYVPGLLSFREVPVLLQAISRVKGRVQVVLVDGHGAAHPRGMGMASHLGLHLEVPTVGCAKNSLVGEWELPGPTKGERSWILLNGVRVGAVLRSRDRVRPVFVSPGHRIGVEGALKVVLCCLGGRRIPEPLREAHLLVEKAKRLSEGFLEPEMLQAFGSELPPVIDKPAGAGE